MRCFEYDLFLYILGLQPARSRTHYGDLVYPRMHRSGACCLVYALILRASTFEQVHALAHNRSFDSDGDPDSLRAVNARSHPRGFYAVVFAGGISGALDHAAGFGDLLGASTFTRVLSPAF